MGGYRTPSTLGTEVLKCQQRSGLSQEQCGLCTGEWRAARVGVGSEEGWETQVGSGKRWLSWLEAGTPLNLHRAAPMGQSRLAAQGRS